MRIMISGGGTGGHTSPGVAIVQELRKRDPHLYVQWVGKAGAIEERVAGSLDVPFRALPAAPWPRGSRLKQLFKSPVFGTRMGRSLAVAHRYLRMFQPQVVIGVGGYVSAPLLLMAQLSGVPTFIHEQNKRLGKANGLLARKAARVFLSFPDSVGEYPRDRAAVVGNPVRTGFFSPPDREEAKRVLGMNPRMPLVLVVGGSQGAQSINRAVGDWLRDPASADAQVLWMTGQHSVDEARRAVAHSRGRVDVAAFIEDMPTACAAADVIVSRAGASSTAEIAAIGRASILIPYPFATDDHQTANANAFVEAGAATLLRDGDCDCAHLGAALNALLSDAAQRGSMEQAALQLAKPHAAELIADAVLEQIYKP